MISLGRFDGENYDIGLFDICLQPYTEVMDEIRRAMEAAYPIAAGEREPAAADVTPCPAIAF